jgi:large subunit ribosomal protein L10
MQRNEKQEMVSQLHEKMAKAQFAAAIGYGAIDAAATVKLRKTFRDSKVDYKVGRGDPAANAFIGTETRRGVYLAADSDRKGPIYGRFTVSIDANRGQRLSMMRTSFWSSH